MLRMSIRSFASRVFLFGLVLCDVATLTLAGSAAAQVTMPLWPHGTPEPAQTAAAETDNNVAVSTFPAGHKATSLANVTVPTLSVYPPAHGIHNGAAALVFPGGGYVHLAWTKEGLDTCDWLNSIGMTCLLVKYRVPEAHFPQSHADLEDAQQAIRLAREHSTEWHLDPTRIGVVGFSAGGNLAALLSTHFNDDHIGSTPAAADARLTMSARPDFAVLVYPAYLALDPGQTALDPTYNPPANTPPTFITAAENDKTYGRNSLVYYRALLDAAVPAELLFFPSGGHGFGTYPKGAPTHWTDQATEWLRQIGVIPALTVTPEQGPATGQPVPTTVPCPIPMPPNPGRPDPKAGQPAPNIDPNCPPPAS
jgi:acetyl esterase/lipase